MPLVIPASAPYQSPLSPVAAFWDREPVEGSRSISGEIDWSVMGGASGCVALNAAQSQPMTFTQIVALYVDNSQCGLDITFAFPDTSSTIVAPAYSCGYYPVNSNQLQFYVYLKNPPALVQNQIKTSFQLFNNMPPQMAFQASQQQLAATSLSAISSTTVFLIPATVLSGTLQGLSIVVGATGGASAPTISFRLADNNGGGNVLWRGAIQGLANASLNGVLASLTGLSLPFVLGIGLVISLSGSVLGTSNLTASAYYKTP